MATTNTVSTWYSPRVANISKNMLEDNMVNRYKNFIHISLGGLSKIEFTRKEKLEIPGPYEAFYVTAKYEYRPDLLAYELYGSSLYAWAILAVNNFKTIYDMTAGSYIHVPLIAQVLEVN